MSQISTQQPQSSHKDDVRTRVWFEGNNLVRENYQPSRLAVLAEVEQRRNNPGSVVDLGFGRAVLTIPQLDYQRLLKGNPALKSMDSAERTKAWQRFFKSKDSEPYRNFTKI